MFDSSQSGQLHHDAGGLDPRRGAPDFMQDGECPRVLVPGNSRTYGEYAGVCSQHLIFHLVIEGDHFVSFYN